MMLFTQKQHLTHTTIILSEIHISTTILETLQ